MIKNTFSLVAKDLVSGKLAVAGASHWFAYATLVPFAKAGVGAIATQAEVNTWYGTEGLKLLERGLSAEETLNSLITKDSNKSIRQVIVIDNTGKVAGFTGDSCVKFAMNFEDKQIAVAGNMLANDSIVKGMLEYYKNSNEEFELKIIKTLQKGQELGGDLRGKRSAGMLVVNPEATGVLEVDTVFNLRVDDNPEPFKELERLYFVAKAYRSINMGDRELFELNNKEEAFKHYKLAFELQPENIEIKFWYAKALSDLGNIAESKKLFDEITTNYPNWKEYYSRIFNK